MNAHALEILEYPALIDSICEYAQSGIGIAQLRKLRPEPELARIRKRRELYRDLLELHTKTALDYPSLQMEDLSEVFRRAAPEDAAVDGAALKSVGTFLETVRHVVLFLGQERVSPFATLREFCRNLSACEGLCSAINRCIDRDGSVLDNATETLGNLRRHAAATEHRIQRELEELFKETNWSDTFQEHFVTRRNGRYVVPVRKDARTPPDGVVHDLSNSGQTLFVEPGSTLGLGNELSRTHVEEREEVRRILGKLTSDVRAHLEALRIDQRILAELDAACAVARWAQENDCELPVFGGELRLLKARHPLLQIQFRREQATPRRTVVPMDFQLPPGVKTLAVTGSNTGGKTVVLKTLGLLCLAAQSGLPVPVAQGSSFPVFDQILADIGDEQSLSANLSTFSSHVAHIGEILRLSRHGRNLVLLDELGSGTDPVEGGALACAVLSALTSGSTLTVATTHLSLVKNYVHSRQEMMNGAVRFDERTLQPEYVLEIGRPGASHALQIARGLGLPKELLAVAEKLLSPDELRLEEMLRQLEKDRSAAARSAAEGARLERQWREKTEAVEKELAQLRKERRQLLLEAHQEADALVSNTRREMERLVRQIRESAKDGAKDISAEELGKVHRELSERSRRLQEGARMRAPVPSKPLEKQELVPQRRVWIERLHAHGIVESTDGKQVTVNVDGISFSMDAKELEGAQDGRDAETAEAKIQFVRPKLEGRTPSELNLIGMRVEDALERLSEFIDRSLRAGLPEVRIVHGFGTGRLRAAVQQWLARCPVVAGFRTGREGKDPGRGGCTIVTFE